jgi:hypothetical protein
MATLPSSGQPSGNPLDETFPCRFVGEYRIVLRPGGCPASGFLDISQLGGADVNAKLAAACFESPADLRHLELWHVANIGTDQGPKRMGCVPTENQPRTDLYVTKEADGDIEIGLVEETRVPHSQLCG